MTSPRPAPAPRAPRARRTSSGWVVGRLAGAPVVLTPSWFVAAAVLAFLFAPAVRGVAPHLGAGTYVAALVFVVLVLFGSVFLHEAAHAIVARRRGHHVHELSLTVWGGQTSFSGGRSTPLDSFLVAVVGPATNLVLAAAFWLPYLATRDGDHNLLTLFLYAGAFSNGFVGAFNLIPALPLDGGQMLESAVWAATRDRDKGTVAAGWGGRILAVAVVAWAVGRPLLQHERASLTTTVWAVVIAGFLWSGASSSVTAARARTAVAHLRATDLMTPATTVPSTATVAAARAHAIPGHALVAVDPAGAPVAAVDPTALAAVPVEHADATGITAVAVALVPGAVLDAGATGSDLVGAVAEVAPNAPVLVVVHGGAVVGLLPVQAVIQAVRDANAKRR